MLYDHRLPDLGRWDEHNTRGELRTAILAGVCDAMTYNLHNIYRVRYTKTPTPKSALRLCKQNDRQMFPSITSSTGHSDLRIPKLCVNPQPLRIPSLECNTGENVWFYPCSGHPGHHRSLDTKPSSCRRRPPSLMDQTCNIPGSSN